MKSSQGSIKLYDGCWTQPKTTSVYTKENKNVKVTMKFEAPKRNILKPTLSIDTVQRVLRWERQTMCYGRKKQGPMA